MRDLIYKWFDPSKVIAAGNEFFMGVASLKTGKYHILGVNHPEPREALAASAAAPIFYEPRQVHLPGLGKQLCVDGGIVRATPLRAAFAAGATHIYVCLTEAHNMALQGEFNNVKDVGARTIAIMAHSIFVLDLKLALLENTLAKNGLGGKRFVDITVIEPPQPLEGDPMEFHPKRTAELIQQGYEDAKNIVG
jgi:predicted patatin/cPLA2 family phospholipase